MTETEFFEGEVYDGEPDDIVRHREGRHDTDLQPRSFISPTQANVSETLSFYKENASDWPFDPDGMCLACCRTARNIGPMFASAKDAQDATPTEHRVFTISKIRRGMVMYFDTVGDSNPFGHIVTVAGRAKGVPTHLLESLIVWTNSVKANELVAVRANYFGLHWADEFKFAATWLNGQELILPEQQVEKPETEERSVLLDVMHVSMQAGDSREQKKNDVTKLFTRADTRRVDVISGTEAVGDNMYLAELLEEVAEAHGYRFVRGGDCWQAIRRGLINQPFETKYHRVVQQGHRQLGILETSFRHIKAGKLTFLTCHLLKGEDDRPENVALLREVGTVARKAGEGRDIVFYSGDQNINDRRNDTFLGEPFTSAQDELEKYEGTHGDNVLDVWASFNKDHRVSAKYVRVLDDSEFKLATDHKVVEAGFSIKF